MRSLPILLLMSMACGGKEGSWEPHIVCETDAPATMGSTPLKRLTQSQYNHSVQDVFGLTGSYSPLLAEDEKLGVFAANTTAAVDMATIQMYQAAAEAVAGEADLGAIDDCNLLATPAETCATKFMDTVGPRLFRRPLTEAEQSTFNSLYQNFGDGDHSRGLRVVVEAMLQSPAFLYHPDFNVVAGVVDGALQPLDSYALANRLAGFLWDSVPDATLLEAASTGALLTEEGLRAETLRVMADPKTVRGITRFHLQWLEVDHLEEIEKDPETFPNYTPDVVQGLKQETAEFADFVIRYGDGELSTLLSADFTVLNEAIADYYDLPEAVEPKPLTPVYLHSDRRAGILSHGSVLSALAHPKRTSITRRGKLIRERLFCDPITQPPENATLKLDPVPLDGTNREVVEVLSANPACAGCHVKMDYIGFGFEHFDAAGHYRVTQNGQPIDANGELTGTDVDGPFRSAPELADALLDSNMVRSCVSRQWLTFALGRELDTEDGCSMSEAYEAMHKPNNLRELLLAIVMSNSFRHRRADEGGQP